MSIKGLFYHIKEHGYQNRTNVDDIKNMYQFHFWAHAAPYQHSLDTSSHKHTTLSLEEEFALWERFVDEPDK